MKNPRWPLYGSNPINAEEIDDFLRKRGRLAPDGKEITKGAKVRIDRKERKTDEQRS